MSKQATAFDLALAPREAATPVHQWIYESLRGAILGGRLRPGARLPSTRELAAQLEVARGTVVGAFAQLAAEGYVHGSIGSGTHVSAVLPEELLHASETVGAADRRPARRRASGFARRLTTFPPLANRASRAFRPNVPAVDQFPMTLWAQLTARRLRRATPRDLLTGELLGYLPLRSAIAEYLASARGVRCEPAQVMIVSGVQEALDLVARLAIDPGDTVCLEEPGYRGAAQRFAAAGARIVAEPVDAEGMVVRPAVLRRARLVYVTPAHQYPLGVAMSLPRRLALLDAIRVSGALVLEDDYDSEYRYAGRPLPALQGLDRAGQVLFVGSFSKVMFPSLRIGYLVLPGDLVERFAAARSLISRHMPVLEQAVVADFLDGGHFARHLRRMRELYAERRGVLLACAQRQLAGALELSPIEAGLQTIGWLPDGVAAEPVAAAAWARHVEVVPLRPCYRGAMPRDGLQLGFAAVAPRELRRGVTELAELLARPGRVSAPRSARTAR